MTIKLRLQAIIDARGISQRELSRISGVRQERISRICKAFIDRIELDHVDAISNALNVPPSEWIVWTRSDASTLQDGESISWTPQRDV